MIAVYVSCSKNPGVFQKAKAKWAICAYDDKGVLKDKREGVAIALKSTCKRASLIALRDALLRFNKPAPITFYIEDPFVRNMLKTNMPYRWSTHNWRKFRYDREIKNLELWREVYSLIKRHAVKFAGPEDLARNKQLKEMEVR